MNLTPQVQAIILSKQLKEAITVRIHSKCIIPCTELSSRIIELAMYSSAICLLSVLLIICILLHLLSANFLLYLL